MHKEKQIATMSGWAMFFFLMILLLGSIGLLIMALLRHHVVGIVGSSLGLLASLFLLPGLFVVNPNEAVALLLFGDYKGTTRQGGMRYTNPFYTKMKLSLKARNLNGDRLKVNDLSGNPIEIAAVVVWRVHDTAEACCSTSRTSSHYVKVQSESAVRHLASAIPTTPHDERSEPARRHRLGERTAAARTAASACKAGIEVIEARLAHLAYAPEIAARDAAAAAGQAPSSPRASASSKARSAWSRWRWKLRHARPGATSTTSARPRW
jgi:regulator of protease activity HflC (stomatin/prohibitin superfamily)